MTELIELPNGAVLEIHFRDWSARAAIPADLEAAGYMRASRVAEVEARLLESQRDFARVTQLGQFARSLDREESDDMARLLRKGDEVRKSLSVPQPTVPVRLPTEPEASGVACRTCGRRDCEGTHMVDEGSYNKGVYDATHGKLPQPYNCGYPNCERCAAPPVTAEPAPVAEEPWEPRIGDDVVTFISREPGKVERIREGSFPFGVRMASGSLQFFSTVGIVPAQPAPVAEVPELVTHDSARFTVNMLTPMDDSERGRFPELLRYIEQQQAKEEQAERELAAEVEAHRLCREGLAIVQARETRDHDAAQAEVARQLTELQQLYAAFEGSGHSPKNPREAAQAIGQLADDGREAQADVARLTEELDRYRNRKRELDQELASKIDDIKSLWTDCDCLPGWKHLNPIGEHNPRCDLHPSAKEPSGGEGPGCATPGCIYKGGHLGKCFEPGDVVPATTEPAKPASDTTAPDKYCCHACFSEYRGALMLLDRMILCNTCGNKRCPKADDHRNACTGSNESGQVPARLDGGKGGEAWVPHPDVGEGGVPDVDAEMLINGGRRKFVDRVQYYLNELLDNDAPLHVIGHIESECADYEKLIRDAVKVYGNRKAAPAPEPAAPPDAADKPLTRAEMVATLGKLVNAGGIILPDSPGSWFGKLAEELKKGGAR